MNLIIKTRAVLLYALINEDGEVLAEQENEKDAKDLYELLTGKKWSAEEAKNANRSTG